MTQFIEGKKYTNGKHCFLVLKDLGYKNFLIVWDNGAERQVTFDGFEHFWYPCAEFN